MKTERIIIREFILEHKREAAVALDKLEPDKLALFFNDSSIEWLLELIPQMNPQLVLKVLELMNQKKVNQLFELMDIQYALILIRMMNENLVDALLNRLSIERSNTIMQLLNYLKDSVGSHIDHTVLTLNDSMTVKNALEEAKRYKTKIHPNLFVLTPERKLVGSISVSDLIAENPKSEINSIMNTSILALHPETPVRSILSRPEWNEFYSLPVVDSTSVFQGVIKLETIRTILASTEKVREGLGDDTVSALGELYQIGLAGLVRSATDMRSLLKE